MKTDTERTERQKAEEKKIRRVPEFARDESGKYIYVGGYRSLSIGEEEYRKTVIFSLLLLLPALALTVLTGCISGTGIDDAGGILVFYVIGLVLLIMTAFALLGMLRHGRRMKNYDYKTTAGRLPFLAFGLAVCGAGGLVAIGIRLARGLFVARPTGAAVLIASFAAQTVAGVLTRRKMERWSWEEEKGLYEMEAEENDHEA